ATTRALPGRDAAVTSAECSCTHNYISGEETVMTTTTIATPDLREGYARVGGLPRRRARPARLQPVVAAGGLHRVYGRQAGGRHPRAHPRARRRVRDGRRPRLGRNGRVDA